MLNPKLSLLTFFLVFGISHIASAADNSFKPLNASTVLHMTSEGVYVLQNDSSPTPVSVVTRLRFPAREEHDAIDSIILAGFSTAMGGNPDDLAIGWRKEGWFNVWRFGLETQLGNIPAQLEPLSERGWPAGHQLVYLQNTAPEAGHIYEATLSYDPGTGYLAVSVLDATDQTPYYNGVIPLAPLRSRLYAGAGFKLAPGANPSQLRPEVEIVKVSQ